jgi:16S rRNA (guanine966-N2)-methyltransferase
VTRIIAGAAKGRRLGVPKDGTRPTADAVRESIFSSLTARWSDLEDVNVLDLFAGTGAFGLEALSRGAATAVFVESDRQAVRQLQANIDAVGLAGAQVLGRTVQTVLAASPPPSAPFDLVFADPPYADAVEVLPAVRTALAVPGWLADDALVVLEHAARQRLPDDWPAGFEPWPVRSYGQAAVEPARWYRPAS